MVTELFTQRFFARISQEKPATRERDNSQTKGKPKTNSAGKNFIFLPPPVNRIPTATRPERDHQAFLIMWYKVFFTYEKLLKDT